MQNGKTTINISSFFQEPIYGCNKLIIVNNPPTFYYDNNLQINILKIINYINKYRINKLNILMNFGNLNTINDNKFMYCIISSNIKSLKIHYTVSVGIYVLSMLKNMQFLQKITLYQIDYYGAIFHQQIIKVLTNNYKLINFKIFNYSYTTEMQNKLINIYKNDIQVILTRNKNNHINTVNAIITIIVILKVQNKLIFTKEIIQKIAKYLYITKYEFCWTFN